MRGNRARSEIKPNLNSRRLQMNDKKALDKIFEEGVLCSKSDVNVAKG